MKRHKLRVGYAKIGPSKILALATWSRKYLST